MKKVLITISVAILMALCSAPSFSKAAEYVIGQVWYRWTVGSTYTDYLVDIYIKSDIVPTHMTYSSSNQFQVMNSSNLSVKYQVYYHRYWDDNGEYTLPLGINSGYCPTLINTYSWYWIDGYRYFYNDLNDFYDNVPPEIVPEEPSIAEQRWDEYYEWFKEKYGFYPLPGSLIDILRKLALGDESEDTVITFPSLTPSPTPTPTPTPIPVQTIFVPDGNGNTTIIYQYPDPTTGVITQSPYNPNITNNIEIDCNCDGGSSNGIFSPDPQDPAALTSSMLWADGFGVEISENPLTVANNSQQSLSDAAAEYSDSVAVVSNSFNVLPFKWLTLVGLLGGILIIAGLIKTFLGG